MWVSVALFIGILIVCEVTPVHGECDPSNAVVAVASVLSTLGFVMVVLAIAYLVVRRRRTVSRSLKFGEKRDVYGHVNSAFATEEKDGPWRPESTLNTKSAGTGINIDKTWNSLPRKDKFLRLTKEGSYSSLNGNYSSTDPEVISVTLESQDIIGLGFNICGGYNDGIQVSEVNSRGPAKECGDIKVGDRILSVTVCYEHIVYEDALTILSYASPYPVKIRLQKATEDNVKSFDGKNIKVDNRRLSHPLFRSRSLEAVKSSSHKDVPSRTSHPKRTQSDLKSGHKLLKWPGKHSKKEKHSPTTKEDSSTFKWQRQPDSHQVNVDIEHSRRNSDIPLGVRLSRIQDAQNSDNEEDDDPFDVAEEPELEFNAQLTAAATSPSQAASYSPKVIPDKPERKNRRKSDVAFGVKEIQEADTILASNTGTITATPPSGEFWDARISEEVIVPETLHRPNNTGHLDVQASTGEGKDISGALDILRKFAFKDHESPIRSPSPDKDPVEEEFILPESKADQGQLSAAPPFDHDTANNNNNTKSPTERGKPKNLNEEILEMLIAMNSFPPGTQGWAGLAAGGPQGGVTDDFVPNNLGFVPQPVPKTVTSKQATNVAVVADSQDEEMLLGGLKVPPLNSNGGLAYEIRDDLVSGQPFAVAINKNKHRQQQKSGESRSIVRSASDQVMTSHDKRKAPSTLHTSASFDSSAGQAMPGFDSATWNVDIGDQLSDDSDWLGSNSFQ